jgi:hypothetical protein
MHQAPGLRAEQRGCHENQQFIGQPLAHERAAQFAAGLNQHVVDFALPQFVKQRAEACFTCLVRQPQHLRLRLQQAIGCAGLLKAGNNDIAIDSQRFGVARCAQI